MNLRALKSLIFVVSASIGCATTPKPPPNSTTVTVPSVATTATTEALGYHCDGLPFHVGSNDYCAYDTPATWREAQRACDSISARLISFNSQAQYAALAKAFGSPIELDAEAYWIGLSEPEETEGGWRWVDETRLTYAHWNKGEPNDDGENEDCAEWKLGNGSWNDAPCWSSRRYICQQVDKKPLNCGSTRVYTEGGELCFSAEAADWETAQSTCAEDGGRLAVLSTKEKDEAIHKVVGPKLGVQSIWIAYSDVAREGSWRWASGARFDFQSWKDGEPNDFQGDEDCAEWFPEDGLMNDLVCTAKRPYVCERLPN